MARRTLGVEYGPLNYDEDFKAFCKKLFSYQYIVNSSEITEPIINFLYEHSNGITAIVVGLLHDSQEIAILDGTESLDISSLSKAYKHRMAMINHFIVKTPARYSSVKKEQIIVPHNEINVADEQLISRLSKIAINGGLDVVETISKQLIVEQI